jgi:hypothetical protein
MAIAALLLTAVSGAACLVAWRVSAFLGAMASHADVLVSETRATTALVRGVVTDVVVPTTAALTDLLRDLVHHLAALTAEAKDDLATVRGQGEATVADVRQLVHNLNVLVETIELKHLPHLPLPHMPHMPHIPCLPDMPSGCRPGLLRRLCGNKPQAARPQSHEARAVD